MGRDLFPDRYPHLESEDDDDADILDYWDETRRPLPCLVFVLPFLAVYELGVIWLGGLAPVAFRTGADAWIRRALESLGLSAAWTLPLLILGSLFAWQLADARRCGWRLRGAVLLGMALESLIWAVALIGLSRGVDVAFASVEAAVVPVQVNGAEASTNPEPAPGPETPAAPVADPATTPAVPRDLAVVLGFVGAGVYEEALFRLFLIPAVILFLRVMMTPKFSATLMAMAASALLFALAHHAGGQGEPFTWFAFVFRGAAGLAFATLFVLRGFGIAVGAHIAYDIFVGWLGWHF